MGLGTLGAVFDVEVDSSCILGVALSGLTSFQFYTTYENSSSELWPYPLMHQVSSNVTFVSGRKGTAGLEQSAFHSTEARKDQKIRNATLKYYWLGPNQQLK